MASGLSDILRGARFAFQGATHAFRRGRVLQTCWPLFLTSLVLTLLLQGGLILLVLRFTRGDDVRAWWAVAGMVVLRFLGIVASLIAGALLGLLLTTLFVPLLTERIFYTSWRALDAARADELLAAEGLSLRQEIGFGLRRLGRLLPRIIGAFLLSFVPLLGLLLGPAAEAFVAARFLSWELLEPWMSRRAMSWDEQIALLQRERWLLVGFALPFVPSLAIPLVGPFLFTVAQAAMPVLVREVFEKSPTGETGSGDL